MPRNARFILPDVPLHLIQRGNNRQPCFYDDADRSVYLRWLGELSKLTGCCIHSYVLMSNHVHLLISAADVAGAGALMKALGQRYAQHFNRRYARSGTPWDGRYKSCMVQDETYLLVCQRYIELNPVRAGMVGLPGDYKWSSYLSNAEGYGDPLITPHSLYQRLGVDTNTRCAAYLSLFDEVLEKRVVEHLRSGINCNFAVGDQAFLRKLQSELKL